MIDRRTFLEHTTVLGASVAGFCQASAVLAQQRPTTKFHAPRPMMVGLNAFSCARMLNAVALGRKGPGMSLLELLDYCANPDHRFDAVVGGAVIGSAVLPQELTRLGIDAKHA